MFRPAATGDELYEARFVRGLFQETAATYGAVNLVSSFGFCQRWRQQCVRRVPVQPGMVAYDLMCGMGECWPALHRRLQGRGTIVGLDFSPAMCQRAHVTGQRLDTTTRLLEENVLGNSIPDASADCVISSFGLKTFSSISSALRYISSACSKSPCRRAQPCVGRTCSTSSTSFRTSGGSSWATRTATAC